MQHINDVGVRQAAGTALDDFEHRALPHFPELRQQVIHDDANPDNVLVNADMSDVVGFFDFGDLLRAPLIVDVAVAASYLGSRGDNPLQYMLPFVAGYHSVTELHDIELELFFDLVRTRLTTTVANRYWRMAAHGGDDACQASGLSTESEAHVFLAWLDNIGRDYFTRALQGACAVSER